MRRLTLTLIATLAAVLPAFAQDYAWQNFAAQDAMNTLHHQLLRQTIEGSQSQGDPAPTRPAPEIVTTYSTSRQVSAKAQRQFLNFIKERSGDEAERAVAGIFAQRDPQDMWAELVAEDGLAPGDTVDAMASYFALNWVIANQQPEADFSLTAVQQQVRTSMKSNPAFQDLDDAGRQEFAEILMMNFLLQQAVLSDAYVRGDQQMMQQLADAAVARFKSEMGVDLRTLKPTSAGLVAGAS